MKARCENLIKKAHSFANEAIDLKFFQPIFADYSTIGEAGCEARSNNTTITFLISSEQLTSLPVYGTFGVKQ